jgi:hypothetical protein
MLLASYQVLPCSEPRKSTDTTPPRKVSLFSGTNGYFVATQVLNCVRHSSSEGSKGQLMFLAAIDSIAFSVA